MNSEISNKTYQIPREFPSPFNSERMLHSRIAIWSYLKSDYQIYDVNHEAWPAIQLTPANTERTCAFHFADDNAWDTQSRTFTLYRPYAEMYSQVDMAIWHTGGWLCRLQLNQMVPVYPILAVSDPAKLVWVGNVGLQQSVEFMEWLNFQTPFFYRPIICNRLLRDNTPKPPAIPAFVAEALLEKALTTGETCPISMNALTRGAVYVTSCFHLFQREALDEWRTKNAKCPVCRAYCETTAC